MNKFQKIIIERGLTKEVVANQLGISRQHVYNVINGKLVGKKTALKIQEWSGGKVSAVELMGM